jgi:hypothetical protein
MKISDDYKAKFEFWAKDRKPQPDFPPPLLPKFKSKRFSSYEEMNQWKRELLGQIADEIARKSRK